MPSLLAAFKNLISVSIMKYSDKKQLGMESLTSGSRLQSVIADKSM